MCSYGYTGGTNNKKVCGGKLIAKNDTILGFSMCLEKTAS